MAKRKNSLAKQKVLQLKEKWCIVKQQKMMQKCRRDGIGRLSGFKIRRSSGRAGSSPAAGTKPRLIRSAFPRENAFGFIIKLKKQECHNIESEELIWDSLKLQLVLLREH